MKEILEIRKLQIQEELVDLFGDWFQIAYSYSEESSINVFNTLDLIKYVSWEMENEKDMWRERSEREKKDLIRLLSEYIVITKTQKLL
jgi:hypothetical protein